MGCRYVLVRGAILVVEWLVGMCWAEETFRLFSGLWVDVGQRSSSGC